MGGWFYKGTQGYLNAVIQWVIRHARVVVVVSTILSLVSAYFMALLYMNLKPDLEELLPRSSRSVVDLEKVVGRLESTSNLGVLVFSRDIEASKRFVNDLARSIQEARSPLVARVEYRINEEMRFFESRRALFVDVPDLVKVRDYIRDRIEYEKELFNPINIFSEVDIPEPRLNLGMLNDKYSGQVSSFTKFKDGYYANRAETVRVMLVYLQGKASGTGNAKALLELIRDQAEQLNPKSYSPDLEIRFTGDVTNLVEESNSLVSDLEFSGILVSLLVTLSMWVYFRDALATVVVNLSVFAGTLITFGVAYFVVGYLNANTAFLGSIVVGNGINFGIIVTARFIEEYRVGASVEQAVQVAVQHTLRPTLTAALAAGLSYGSLMTTGFRGFNQFGVIGLIGMVICWICSFTTLPALLVLVGHRWRTRNLMPGHSKFGFSSVLASLVSKASWPIVAVSAALIVLSVVTVLNYQGTILEIDTSRLRDKKSMTQGSGYFAKYLDQVFERYISPIIILPGSREETRTIAASLKEKKKEEGKQTLISAVYTLDDFIPSNQPEKIEILREIRQMLSPRVIRGLSDADRAQVRDFLKPESFKPFGMGDLPEQIKDRFREKNGSLGNIVLVEPILNKDILYSGDNQVRFIRDLREVTDAVSPGAPIVGQMPLIVDMWGSIRRDGPKATLVAFVSVIVLVAMLFRNVRTSALVLGSLLTGVLWLAALILKLDYKINFLNFIALPITFGIGVDYAVNIVQRYSDDGPGSILQVIQSTGGAVALASLTTIIGYGSLLVAGNQGFVSFGRIAILGEFTCLGSAAFGLAACLYLRDFYRKRGQSKPSGPTQEEVIKAA